MSLQTSFLRQIFGGSKFPQHSMICDHDFVEKVYSGKVVEKGQAEVKIIIANPVVI